MLDFLICVISACRTIGPVLIGGIAVRLIVSMVLNEMSCLSYECFSFETVDRFR